MINIPCGRTLGHGEYCSHDYLCSSCTEIQALRAAVTKALKFWHDYRINDTEEIRRAERECRTLIGE